MRIAYVISAYKYFDQLARLVHRLHEPDVGVFIHVDKRSGPVDTLRNATRHLSDVHFLERHSCAWGGFGHVAASLKGLEAAATQPAGYDYVVLVTGQDYPIKHRRRIREVMEKAAGRSFMNYFPLPRPEWEGGGLGRIERWHLRVSNRHFVLPGPRWSVPKRRFPTGFRPFGGSSYWCLAWDCVRYVREFVRANPGFVRFFRYVDVPDELFFQTILLNSPLRERIVDDDLRYVEWRDLTSGSPAVLTSGDFSAIQASPKLFARKFDATVDAKILDLIDERLLGESAR